MKKFHSSRRTFLGFCASLPLIGFPIRRSNRTRLQDIIGESEHPKIMVLFHDYKSALHIVPHLGLGGVAISVYGTSQFVHPGQVASVCFYQSRPNAKTNVLDPINGDGFREARMCDVILSQHPRKQGTFTVVKNRLGAHGEVLNVFNASKVA